MLSAVLLLNAKPGYALLSILLLLLLPRQFSSRVAYAATVGGSIVPSGLLTLLFMKLAPNASEFLAQFLGADNHVDSPAQLRHVLTHPLAFAGAVGSTLDAQGVFSCARASPPTRGVSGTSATWSCSWRRRESRRS